MSFIFSFLFLASVTVITLFPALLELHLEIDGSCSQKAFLRNDKRPRSPENYKVAFVHRDKLIWRILLRLNIFLPGCVPMGVCVCVCVNDGKSDQSLCVLCDSTCRNRLIISLVHSTLLWDISALCFRLFSQCGRKSLGPDIPTDLLRTLIRHSCMFTYLAYSTLIPKLLKGKKAILFFIFVTYLCCSSTETINKDQKYNNSNYLIRKSCRNCRWSVRWKWWLNKRNDQVRYRGGVTPAFHLSCIKHMSQPSKNEPAWMFPVLFWPISSFFQKLLTITDVERPFSKV